MRHGRGMGCEAVPEPMRRGAFRQAGSGTGDLDHAMRGRGPSAPPFD